jgi:hypothetical protein
MLEVIYILLITSTALLMGNEFSIAFFIHPSLTRSDHKAFIPAIQVFARLLGRIMPFWMAGTLAAHLALALASWSSDHAASLFMLYASGVWLLIVIFSVIFPVPINTRVAQWNPSALPPNWESERKSWDTYNTIRVGFIVLAFLLLLIAFKHLA